jgi:DNA-binding Lrp family transcriptional regulator
MKAKIYEYLKGRRGPISVPQIAAAMGADEETVRRNVGKLLKDRLIEREPSGSRYNVRYRVCPPRGSQVVPVIKVPRIEGQANRTIRGGLTAHLTSFLHGLCIIKRM